MSVTCQCLCSPPMMTPSPASLLESCEGGRRGGGGVGHRGGQREHTAMKKVLVKVISDEIMEV